MYAIHYFIQYKRSECVVFPHRSVQTISCGIGNVLVMRFVITEQSSAVSCERFVGMQMVRLMKVWFRDRFVIGMWTQKMSKTQLLNAIVIESGNDFFGVGVKSVSV